LLTDHQAVTDALTNLGKSGFATELSVSKDEDNDFTSVTLRPNIAKHALNEQKTWIEEQLKELGIDLG
jgi:hypothetical protein